MKYKTNVILNNSRNTGNMVTFEYEREKPLTEKEQHTINMIIADEFGSLEDVAAFSDIADFFGGEYDVKLSGRDSMDFFEDLEKRLEQFEINLEEYPTIKTLPNDKYISDYKLNETDFNTIIFSERGIESGLTFYDKETNNFINKKDYAKKCLDIQYKDWFEYDDLSFIGTELNMLRPLIEEYSKENNNIVEVYTQKLKDNLELVFLEVLDTYNENEDTLDDDIYKIKLGEDSYLCIDTETFLMDIENSYNKGNLLMDSIDSFYFEKDGKKYNISSYLDKTLKNDLKSSTIIMTSEMSKVIKDLIERNQMRQSIKGDLENFKRKESE